ncbi:hypothetical protein BHE74_00025497 [Ensete ventricosum]|nr:hypothetical protein BHE74_00025497 [Ensete ventricosum]RZR93113.1 hypothetical protein BHM03_00021519 [Ensete ventricosum]
MLKNLNASIARPASYSRDIMHVPSELDVTSLDSTDLIEKHIDVIIGGPASGGDSSSARKAYVWSAVEKRSMKDRDPEITFGSGNEVYLDHNNALVISARVANA